MRSLNTLLLALLLIAGCGPAPTDTAAITMAGGTEPMQPNQQDAKIYLPNIVEDKTQAAATLDEQAWLSYNHEPWGITFDYPADWRVDMPDFEAEVEALENLPTSPDMPYTYTIDIDMQQLMIYGYQVTLIPPEYPDDTGAIFISLEPLTLAPGMTLREWVKIRDRYGLWDHGGDWENYEPDLLPFPRADHPNVDEIWMKIAPDEKHPVVITFYMSIGKLVYVVWYWRPDQVQPEIAEQLVASLEFDIARQQELEASPHYSHDITSLQSYLEEPTPVP